MIFIVHEYTLFTLVRRKSQFKNPEEIADEIVKCCPWYKQPDAVTLGKNNNLKLTGSITEMKRLTKGSIYPEEISRIEVAINQCLYSYLFPKPYHYGNPLEAVESYIQGTIKILTAITTTTKKTKYPENANPLIQNFLFTLHIKSNIIMCDKLRRITHGYKPCYR